MRKTIEIRKIVELVNRRNKLSTCNPSVSNPSVRRGWNSLLEEILHQSGCYEGFNYYSKKDLGEVIRPGIRLGEDGLVHPDIKERFRDTDDTRRFYYPPKD
jgi:hypothetical protein